MTPQPTAIDWTTRFKKAAANRGRNRFIKYLLYEAAGASTTDAIQLGASVLVWGAFVRGAVVFHITMSVNSFTHLWGYRSYQTNDNSKNNVFIGILAAGEGWHNNHHADPRSARHGQRWWELDIAWLLIRRGVKEAM